MWSYAVGMYLAELSPDSLRLVAGYGLSMGAASVLMGAIIGDAVDKFPRLPGKYDMHQLYFRGVTF